MAASQFVAVLEAGPRTHSGPPATSCRVWNQNCCCNGAGQIDEPIGRMAPATGIDSPRSLATVWPRSLAACLMAVVEPRRRLARWPRRVAAACRVTHTTNKHKHTHTIRLAVVTTNIGRGGLRQTSSKSRRVLAEVSAWMRDKWQTQWPYHLSCSLKTDQLSVSVCSLTRSLVDVARV